MRRSLTLFPLALVALALTAVPAAAGGGGHAAATCTGFAEGTEVVMRDSCFEGVGHVAPEGTLTVTNAGALPHTFTAVDGAFDSGVLGPGETATLDVGEPGTYPVYCVLHGTADGAGMAGLLSVGAVGPAAAATSGGGPWDVAALAAVAVAFGIVLLRRRRTSAEALSPASVAAPAD